MYARKRSFFGICKSTERSTILHMKIVRCLRSRSITIVTCILLVCYILYSQSRSKTSPPLSTSPPPPPPPPQDPPFPKRKLTFWCIDFHISPIQDVKHLLSTYNVRFIDKSLSDHCRMTKTCAKDLKVINTTNGISIRPHIQKQFYEAYKDDPEFNSVDVFICFHSVAMCELYIPFNRTIIIISSTRYELGRFELEQWTTLNKNLQLIASNPRNVIAGNNRYDAEYIRYFTGIKTIVLPSFCNYTQATYTPKKRKPFLITFSYKRDFSRAFTSNLTNVLAQSKSSITVGHLREVYKKFYNYSDIAEHPGMIYLPYQVSVMSLFEQYRMNIPLFFPSLDLLTEWQYTYQLLNERTWDGVHGHTKNRSLIPGVLGPNITDPNDESDRTAIRYWLQFSDFYQWPHIIYFNSIEELGMKLATTNLNQVSENMKIYNQEVAKYLHDSWHQILQRIADS